MEANETVKEIEGVIDRMRVATRHSSRISSDWVQLWASEIEALLSALGGTDGAARPQEPCVFTSHEGVAWCGTHHAAFEHVARSEFTRIGWRCPVTLTVFPFGTEFGTEATPADGAARVPPESQDRSGETPGVIATRRRSNE